jgi:hypothetical protein
MGISQAGFVFNSKHDSTDTRALISTLTGETATKIDHPNSREFDIRNHSDVMVQYFADSCFISNHDLAWPIFEQQLKSIPKLFTQLNSPEIVFAYCHYGSGGSYGYAIYENGILARSRFQTTEMPALAPTVEFGSPKQFEMDWLTAPSYLENYGDPENETEKIFYLENPRRDLGEWNLTSVLLELGLIEYFGVCPWETNVEPTYYFFKVDEKPLSEQ